MAWAMGTAAPGIGEVATPWRPELLRARAEVRSHRPSTRPTTLEGVSLESTDKTGDPLCPRVTGWLRRKISAGGEDLSSWVDS
jgi:hypothetical protein